MPRITIREKKVAVIRMLVGSMEKHHKQMNEDLEKYEGDVLKAVLDAHFESLRCSSGNLSLVLEEDRGALAIMYESVLIDEQIAKVRRGMQPSEIKCPKCGHDYIYRRPQSAQRLCCKCGWTWFPSEVKDE